MRGQEKVFDKEEIKAILDNLAVAVVLIASLLMALFIITYQGRQAELQNTGMLASTLGGAITSLASAPDRGVYCVMMPGTQAYYLVLGKVDASEAGYGSKMRAFISAYSPERGTTGISYLPFFGFAPDSKHVPSGKKYVVAFRKTGASSPITMEAVEGTVDMANCDTVAATLTLPATCTKIDYNGDPADKLDIVFVGCGYGPEKLSKFISDVDAHKNRLLSVEPFSTNKNKINIYRVDQMGLSCEPTNDNRAAVALASQCPNDYKIMLENGIEGPGTVGGVEILRISSEYPDVTLHEFGHTFGGLSDEYLSPSVATAPPSAIEYWEKNADPGPTCDKDSSCPKWAGTPEYEGCYKECRFPNWYRPSQNSIMRDPTYPTFNKVSIKILNDKLKAYTATPTPTGGTPTATATPTSGIIISGGGGDIVV